jgi:hypothetical protein
MVSSLAFEGMAAMGKPSCSRPLQMEPTMPIRGYLDHSAFEPDEIDAMSRALEETCKALHIDGQVHDREVIAARIVDLARNGLIDAQALSERLVAETKALRSL